MSPPEYHHSFIIGTGRSGTTLLLSMLNASEEVLCLPEIPTALYFYQKKKNQVTFSATDLKQWQPLKNKLKFIRKIAFDRDTFLNNINKMRSYRDMVTYMDLCFRFEGKSNEKVKYIVDKNPIYTFYTTTISKIFPEARYVAMIRNPFAQINSSLEHHDPGKHIRPVDFYALAWNKYASELNRLKPGLADRLLIVQYEELVSDTEAVLKKITAHLRIPYSENMLTFYKQNMNVPKTDALDENQKVRIQNKFTPLEKPANTSRIDSWKNNLNKLQIDTIYTITKENATLMGYDIVPELPIVKRGPSLKHKILIDGYFTLARRFYFLPISLRERIRTKV